jgi:hypothetical protein
MKKQILILSLLTSAFCLWAWAQNYSIDWFKIAGGGAKGRCQGQVSVLALV